MRYPAILAITIHVLVAVEAAAQSDQPKEGLLSSGLNELLHGSQNAPIEETYRTDLADHVDQDIREAAGIVYVVTAEDIRNAGCRDLEDALMLLPSFTQGRDVDDVIGFAIRGQWAHEGKCLFLLNGMPLNEASYGIFAMGMRLPLENISRIEVIDGPGSVLHGGLAALGTVNIITRTASESEGLTLVGSVANVHGLTTHERGQLYGAHRLGPRTEVSYSGSLTTGHRFAQEDRDASGTPVNYADSSGIRSLNGLFTIRRGGFRGQFYVNDYELRVSDQPYDVLMRTVMASGEQRLRLGKGLQLDLGLLHRVQLPWFYSNGATPEENLTNTADRRTQTSAVFTIRPKKWLGFTLGQQSYLDGFRFYTDQPDNVFALNGRSRLTIWDAALFGETRIHTRFGTLMAGIRGEHHSYSGTAAAPRFGYTAVVGRFHAKLLQSSAFKMPTMQNLNSGPEEGLQREFVWSQEAEVGYRISTGLQFTVALFHTRINDPIVYVYLSDSVYTDSYVNRTSSATQGLESTLRYTGKKFGWQATFSMYQVDRAGTDLPETHLPDSTSAGSHGIPDKKITGTLYVRPSGRDRIGLNAIWNSASYSYQSSGSDDVEPYLRLFPSWMLLGLLYEHTFQRIEGLSASIGCNNLLDARSWIQSPYDNGLQALPRNGREFTLRVEYRFMP